MPPRLARLFGEIRYVPHQEDGAQSIRYVFLHFIPRNKSSLSIVCQWRASFCRVYSTKPRRMSVAQQKNQVSDKTTLSIACQYVWKAWFCFVEYTVENMSLQLGILLCFPFKVLSYSTKFGIFTRLGSQLIQMIQP